MLSIIQETLAHPLLSPFLYHSNNFTNRYLKYYFDFPSKNIFVKTFVVQEICLSSAILEYVASECYLV